MRDNVDFSTLINHSYQTIIWHPKQPTIMKKLLLPLLTLIIGFAAGYYFFNRKAKTAAFGGSTGPYTSATSISYDEAKLLVDTFGTHWMDDNSDHMGGKGWK